MDLSPPLPLSLPNLSSHSLPSWDTRFHFSGSSKSKLLSCTRKALNGTRISQNLMNNLSKCKLFGTLFFLVKNGEQKFTKNRWIANFGRPQRGHKSPSQVRGMYQFVLKILGFSLYAAKLDLLSRVCCISVCK